MFDKNSRDEIERWVDYVSSKPGWTTTEIAQDLNYDVISRISDLFRDLKDSTKQVILLSILSIDKQIVSQLRYNIQKVRT